MAVPSWQSWRVGEQTPANPLRNPSPNPERAANPRSGLRGRSNFRPLAEQVVVDACQLDRRRVAGQLAVHALDGRIEVEQQRPLAVVPDHALDPEEGAD